MTAHILSQNWKDNKQNHMTIIDPVKPGLTPQQCPQSDDILFISHLYTHWGWWRWQHHVIAFCPPEFWLKELSTLSSEISLTRRSMTQRQSGSQKSQESWKLNVQFTKECASWSPCELCKYTAAQYCLQRAEYMSDATTHLEIIKNSMKASKWIWSCLWKLMLRN